VTLAPTALGAVPAQSLTVTTSALNTLPSVTLSGTGSQPTALSATTKDFGHVPVNTSVVASLYLTNYQLTAINITSVNVSAPYTISGGTCGKTLAGSSTCSILVTLTPTALGAVPAQSLTVTTSALNTLAPVTLSGKGVTP
jgi:hypothetical protein